MSYISKNKQQLHPLTQPSSQKKKNLPLNMKKKCKKKSLDSLQKQERDNLFSFYATGILIFLWTSFIISFLFLFLPNLHTFLYKPQFLINTAMLILIPVLSILLSYKYFRAITLTKKTNHALYQNIQQLADPHNEKYQKVKTLSAQIQKDIKHVNQALETSSLYLENLKKQIQNQLSIIEESTEIAAYQTAQTHQSIKEQKNILLNMITEIRLHTRESETEIKNKIQKMVDMLKSVQIEKTGLHESLCQNEHLLSSFLEIYQQCQNQLENTQQNLKKENAAFTKLSNKQYENMKTYLYYFKEEAQSTGKQMIEVLKQYIKHAQILNDTLMHQDKRSSSINEQHIKTLKSLSGYTAQTGSYLNESRKEMTKKLQEFDCTMKNIINNLEIVIYKIHKENIKTHQPVPSSTHTEDILLHNKKLVVPPAEDINIDKKQKTDSQKSKEITKQYTDTLSWLEAMPSLSHHSTQQKE